MGVKYLLQGRNLIKNNFDLSQFINVQIDCLIKVSYIGGGGFNPPKNYF